MLALDAKPGRALLAMVATLGLALASPTAVFARPADPMDATAAMPDFAAADAQEAADAAIVQNVMAAFQSGGFQGLGSQRATLAKVLSRAPERYPLVEVRGDTAVLRYERVGQRGALLLLGVSGIPVRNVEQRYNTYGMAAFLLGSYANEMRQPEEALIYLDRGLALQPDNPILATEKNASMILLRRFADGLIAVDSVLDSPMKLSDPDRASLLRARGFDLTELGRLDDAEQAYRQSLTLEPDHRGALNELTYIAQLRGGAPPAAAIVTTGEKSASGAYLDDKPEPLPPASPK